MPTNGVYKILVVDDSASVIMYVKTILSRRPQFSPIMAYDAESALTLVGIENPDLILLDINLPQVSGLEVCKQIKKMMPTLPIIILTGDLDPTKRFEAYEAGADDFISKPFSGEQLIAHIRYHLHLSALDHTG